MRFDHIKWLGRLRVGDLLKHKIQVFSPHYIEWAKISEHFMLGVLLISMLTGAPQKMKQIEL